MTIRQKAAATAILALLIICLAPLPAAALGLGVGPPQLEITDAARGATYDKTIFVFNGNDQESVFELSASPEIEEWVSFYRNDNLEQPTDRVTVPPNETIPVIARFTIPNDAAEPVYQARLMVRSVPSGEQDKPMGNEVLMQMPINVTISIGGTATISGTVSSITAKNSEVGLPLNIVVDFTNSGDIEIAPTIIARVVKGDDQIAEIKNSTTRVKAGEGAAITLSWDTSGQREGAYLLKVEVTLAKKTIASQELVVELEPPGSIPISGEFTGLRYEGIPAVGTTTKITGSFKNTCSVSIRARLVSEIYNADTLVESARSDEVLVSEAQEGMLVTYFKPERTGSYRLKAQVTFGGKGSEFKELTFNVVESSSPIAVAGTTPAGGEATGSGETGTPFNILYPIMGGVIAAAIGFTVYAIRKKRIF